jgi:hypothetical protein
VGCAEDDELRGADRRDVNLVGLFDPWLGAPEDRASRSSLPGEDAAVSPYIPIGTRLTDRRVATSVRGRHLF